MQIDQLRVRFDRVFNSATENCNFSDLLEVSRLCLESMLDSIKQSIARDIYKLTGEQLREYGNLIQRLEEILHLLSSGSREPSVSRKQYLSTNQGDLVVKTQSRREPGRVLRLVIPVNAVRKFVRALKMLQEEGRSIVNRADILGALERVQTEDEIPFSWHNPHYYAMIAWLCDQSVIERLGKNQYKLVGHLDAEHLVGLVKKLPTE
ncbi:MAG: hypothetical protein QXZ09_08275 [Candidatus Methanomethylicaceae archaeon]